MKTKMIAILLLITVAVYSQDSVQIGNQVWKTKNMNIGVMIPSTQAPANNGVIEKYCYNNLEENCTKYGGLYSWDEAMQYAVTPGAQGICPDGWHIATQIEWRQLSTYAGTPLIVGGVQDNQTSLTGTAGLDLRQQGRSTWLVPTPYFDGRDLYGFSAVGSGWKYGNTFSNLFSSTAFWSSTMSTADVNWIWIRTISFQNRYFGEYMAWRVDVAPYKASYLPVRCIKD